MNLLAVVDHDVLRGALALMPWDPVTLQPILLPCSISASRSNAMVQQRAVPHTSGLYGFLRLRPGDYRVLIRPTHSAFLPSLRSVLVPLPAHSSVILAAPLRPSASYPPPTGDLVLRGTIHFRRAQVTPARWAAVFGRVEARKNDTWRVISSTWTRAGANGEFALFLDTPPPTREGTRDPLRAIVEIHASPPAGSTLADDDLSDLVLDDGTEDDVRQRQPLARAAIVVSNNVEAGATLSLNQDEYTTLPAGATQPTRHRVILLS